MVPASFRSAWDMSRALQTHVGVAHVAFELGSRHQSCNRIDHDNVECPGADEHVCDLERLFPGIGLRDEQLIHVDAQCFGILGIECMLGIDEGGDTAVALRLSNDMKSECGLAG